MKWLMVSIVVLALALAAASMALGQNTLRKQRLKAEPRGLTATDSAVCDTVTAPESVAMSGFDKPLRSTRETVFVTNHDTLTVRAVNFTATYTDMTGHQLHRASHEAVVDIPPGETRNVAVKSWDVQKAFYYYKNPPSRPRTSATPFKVKIIINYILTDKQ